VSARYPLSLTDSFGYFPVLLGWDLGLYGGRVRGGSHDDFAGINCHPRDWAGLGVTAEPASRGAGEDWLVGVSARSSKPGLQDGHGRACRTGTVGLVSGVTLSWRPLP
jgi:hypothetical protein